MQTRVQKSSDGQRRRFSRNVNPQKHNRCCSQSDDEAFGAEEEPSFSFVEQVSAHQQPELYCSKLIHNATKNFIHLHASISIRHHKKSHRSASCTSTTLKLYCSKFIHNATKNFIHFDASISNKDPHQKLVLGSSGFYSSHEKLSCLALRG